MFYTIAGLRTRRCVESLLILCLYFTFFTGCEQDEALLPTETLEQPASSLTKSDSQDDATADEMEGVATDARAFDEKLTNWRKGRNGRDRMPAIEAVDQLETVLNLKVASGVNYDDASFVNDSVDVSSGDVWTGTMIATVYEKTKSFLIGNTERLRGRNPGVRFISVSAPRRAVDGTTRVYLHAAVGSIVQTSQPQISSLSHFVWGGANTTPASCTIPAEDQIASSVNFELDACYSGNPTPPMGSCGFFSVVTIAVNPFGGIAGIPADFTYENRDWPSGTPASNAPLFVNEGEFIWHQDNDRDEICFNFNKMFQYVDSQVDVIEGPMRTQARALPGFFRNFRRPMGEFVLSEEFMLVANGQVIADFNAHYAFIDYGVRFFFFEPVFAIRSLREL